MHSRRTALFHCFRSLCRLPSVSSQTFRTGCKCISRQSENAFTDDANTFSWNMNGSYRSNSNLIYVSNVTPMHFLTSRKCICCLRCSLTCFVANFFANFFANLFFGRILFRQLSRQVFRQSESTTIVVHWATDWNKSAFFIYPNEHNLRIFKPA